MSWFCFFLWGPTGGGDLSTSIGHFPCLSYIPSLSCFHVEKPLGGQFFSVYPHTEVHVVMGGGGAHRCRERGLHLGEG